ncbi:hypothetical protein SteCoe_13867 [Stentor coeruleus]|uniref:Uncharacterized protein n=1 Tax=Stentor coeruleus TaxID=5963 RepID=A0A1R2C7G6_9CILI|nr:hypothetical protein SteCoe_13867 [Stentor coeruleus]
MVESQSATIKVQLFISCRKLKDVETFSKSDPFVEVFERHSNNQWIKIGQTEVIWDNLNPDFIKNFILDYYFEEQKYLLFKVFDANIENGREVKGLQIGEVECTLAEIVGAKGQQIIKTLHLLGERRSTGNIILRVEEASSINNDEVSITFSAKNLEDQSCCFKPMFYLSRVMESGGNQRVYCSEYSKGTNLTWKTLKKSMQDLCNGDAIRPILFELYDNYSSDDNIFLGSFEFSLQKIIEEGKKIFEIERPKGNNSRKSFGQVVVSNIQVTKIYSFLDYISGGCQINLLIAVDFTGSNGHPNSPSSLHYINPAGQNQYQSALHAVSDILLNYDSDKEVPLYGFGGKINRQLSHCFPLNFNHQSPSVSGISGIMTAYKNALSVVELSGPTLFAKVLSTAVQMAENAQVNQLNQQYFILLILTDGEINDIRESIDWIVRGSNSPLSIVIVGIGNENFASMDRLDADDEPLIDSHGKQMLRDIVQFVPFRNFGNSPTALTKEVLAKIPREITNFFRIKGITPNEAVQAPEYDFHRSYTAASTDRGNYGKLVNPPPSYDINNSPDIIYGYGSFNPPPPPPLVVRSPQNYYTYSSPKS